MAKSTQKLIAVILAVTVGAIFLAPVATTVAESTGTQSVTNESVTASTSEYVQVDGYHLVDGSVTVYGYNQTSDSFELAAEGTDYDVNLEPGEIKANSSSTLIDDGEEIKVSYDYEATDGTTTLVAGFIVTLFLTLLIAVLGEEVADAL